MTISGGKCAASLCIYGCSNSGKTHQAGELAEYVAEQEGKLTRLVSCDTGGWGSIEDKVEAGIVVPTYIVFRSSPFGALQKITKGWWPEDPNDPDSPLLPPEKQKDWASIGGLVIDSMSAAAQLMMRHSIKMEAEGKWRISGQQIAAKFSEDGEQFGTASQGMYGTIQNYIAQYVAQSSALSGWYVMWTALELKGSEEETETRMPIYGPEIIGKARTSSSPAWFNHMLHLYVEGRLDGKGKKGVERKLYTTTHFDERTGIPYLAKTTAPFRHQLPPILEREEATVKRFLELLAESKLKATEELKRKLEKKGER